MHTQFNLRTNARTAVLAAAAGILVFGFNGAASAITDTAFTYSTPKTGHYGISRAMFTPASTGAANDYFIGDDPTDGIGSAASQCFITGVNLPQGATMTQLAVWTASGVGTNVGVSFKREQYNNGAQVQYFTAAAPNNSNARKITTFPIPAANAKIDNKTYHYMLRVCTDANSEFYAARFTYTYDNAGD